MNKPSPAKFVLWMVLAILSVFVVGCAVLIVLRPYLGEWAKIFTLLLIAILAPMVGAYVHQRMQGPR